uniref:Fatty acyl-CoA reductase n=1 Tax=Culicoides sonorensis TaxID=179676 RepID=A0A336LP21_CULSO
MTTFIDDIHREQNGKNMPIFDPEFIFDEYETENIDKMNSPMKDFYRDKTIFMSGGTGFVGLIMLEKLLRCEVKEVFLFVRPKKGKSPEERVNAIFQEPIYVRLRRQKDHYMRKITVVEGNLAHPNLGIDPILKMKVIQNTQIFIHAAADVRFDETLKEAIETNVRGTREMLKLAEMMPHLMCFMYMSTAYANCPQHTIKEKFYETPVDPEVMIKFAETINDDATADKVNILTDRIVHPWPNTYAYTKALAEELMRIYSQKLPIVVVRPSIIMMTYSDPIPGWLNNVYGINGVFVGVGMGVLRIFYIDNRKKADIIPADIVVNSSLAVIWHSVTKGAITLNETPDYKNKGKISAPVYNCVNNVDNPLTWGDVKRASVPMAAKYATTSSLWIGLYNTTRYNWIYYILRIFYHVIPAFFFDFILKLQGQEPRVVKIYKKIHRFAGAIAYFTNNEWTFENNNMRMVLDDMSRVDKKYFISDMKKLKWDDIFDIFGRGIRLYIGKETMDNWQQGQDRYKKIQILHYILLFVIYSFLFWASYHILKFYGLIEYGAQFYCYFKNLLENP